LLEVLITVAIIGILAAVALPAYSRYVIRGNRAAAMQHLVDLGQREQLYLSDARAYQNSVSSLNMSTPSTVSKYYDIAIQVSDGPPPSYTVTATPKASTSQASDGPLSIDSTGAKLPADKW
jgi:type IV pilus assembly protein PilE